MTNHSNLHHQKKTCSHFLNKTLTVPYNMNATVQTRATINQTNKQTNKQKNKKKVAIVTAHFSSDTIDNATVPLVIPLLFVVGFKTFDDA